MNAATILKIEQLSKEKAALELDWIVDNYFERKDRIEELAMIIMKLKSEI